MVKFKKGAFASLRAVRPMVYVYTEGSNIKSSQDVAGFLYHTLVTIACLFIKVQIDVLPNFEPNDYFWKHHWQEGKEEKWEAFARVVREIMCEHGGFKTSELTMQDKFKYKELLKEAHKAKKDKKDQ